MTMPGSVSQIRFIVGSRVVYASPRSLATISVAFGDLISRRMPTLPTLDRDDDGYRILSAPTAFAEEIGTTHPAFVAGGVQTYRRHFIEMSGSFENYLAGFSSKTRSTLNRKRRKLMERSGGTLDIRAYRSPTEVAEFLDRAIPLSRRTYQARLLDAGLPETPEAQADILALASSDSVRAYLLYVDGRPVSYLYLPVENAVIKYAFLGYDPEIADFSPGTVLQLEALERLFVERRYRYFDFTEGEGAHKQLFGRAAVDACSFLLMRRTFANMALLRGLDLFDAGIAKAKSMVERHGSSSAIRRLLRH